MIFDKDFNVSLYRNVGGFFVGSPKQIIGTGFVCNFATSKINDYG